MEIAGNKPRKIPIINKKRPKIKEDKYPKCIPLLSSAYIKIPLSPLSKNLEEFLLANKNILSAQEIMKYLNSIPEISVNKKSVEILELSKYYFTFKENLDTYLDIDKISQENLIILYLHSLVLKLPIDRNILGMGIEYIDESFDPLHLLESIELQLCIYNIQNKSKGKTEEILLNKIEVKIEEIVQWFGCILDIFIIKLTSNYPRFARVLNSCLSYVNDLILLDTSVIYIKGILQQALLNPDFSIIDYNPNLVYLDKIYL